MMISTTILRRSAVALLAVTAFGVVPTFTAPASAQTDCASGIGAGGEYFPVTPTRVFDQSVRANATTNVQIGGRGGVPVGNVLAVGMNVTIDRSVGPGYVAAAPADFQRGANDLVTSLLNVNGPGETVPNFGLVGVDAAGRIKIDTVAGGSGNVRIIVDVFGFVAASCYSGSGSISADDGARLIPVTPARLADSRPIPGSPDTNSNRPLSERQNLKVDVRGQGGVPDRDSVKAVVVNLTGINDVPGNSTYLSAGPAPVPASASDAAFSNGNYAPGEVKANLAIVPLDANGDFFLFNRTGRINVAIDVVGYLEQKNDDLTAGRIVPLEASFRSFDTRLPEFDDVKLTRAWEDWSFEAFANSVRLDGSQVGSQSALFGNLTVTQFARTSSTEAPSTYMTLNPAYADGSYPGPDAPNSNINVAERTDVANAAIVTYGSKGGDAYMVSAFNRTGGTHYLLDVSAVILK